MPRLFANLFFLSFLVSGCTFIGDRSILSESEGRYVGVLVDGVRQGQGRYTFPEVSFIRVNLTKVIFMGKAVFNMLMVTIMTVNGLITSVKEMGFIILVQEVNTVVNGARISKKAKEL